jgi:SNF2 family DNA or RNA helicase
MYLPEISYLVHVRQRAYLVESISPDAESGSHLLDLSCVDDDASGEELQVVWEHEIDAHITKDLGWSNIAKRGFDSPHIFGAYLNAMRWNCLSATDNDIFQSPYRAGIRIDAYQLEPLKKALKLPRVNLFIADDVGLGKTIEAALIAHELLLRKRVNYIVVSCPPSVQEQWKEELSDRFGLRFEIINRDFLTRVRSQRGYQINPWATHSRFIISHKLLIDDEYKSLLRDFFGDMKHQSLLILDEAHHAAPSSGSKYAIDSQFTRSIREIAPKFEHRIFLSATPHNGHSNSFSALLEILDPIRFCRGVPALDKKFKGDIIVRRLKSDLKSSGIVDGFPERRVEQIDISGLPDSCSDLKLPALLAEYSALRRSMAGSKKSRAKSAIEILLIGLQQRLLSSLEAFHKTLEKHSRGFELAAEKNKHETEKYNLSDEIIQNFIQGPLAEENDHEGNDSATDNDPDDEVVEELSKFIEGPEAGQKSDVVKAKQILAEMKKISAQARFEKCGKTSKLLAWIEANQCPDIFAKNISTSKKNWTEKKVIIFTQYEDTLRYLKRILEESILDTDLGASRIAIFSGRTSEQDREVLKQAFNSPPESNPIRILLATDAAREGLNLQAHCYNLFHFDIPWNPSRLEQRNGRIDRFLQPNPQVFCHYFFYTQREEDRVLKKMLEKTQTVLKELGSLSPVIESRLLKSFSSGIQPKKASEILDEIEKSDKADPFTTSVREELEDVRVKDFKRTLQSLRGTLADSKEKLGYDEADLRFALNSALEIMGVDKIKQVQQTPDIQEQNRFAYEFPASHEVILRDSTWIHEIDSLRRPRRAGEKLWEWRKNAPIRKILFANPAKYADTAVQFHLQQRIVQRLLGKFRSQGFQSDELARATVVVSDDPMPRVVLVGRLAVYGNGAARLHEEIVYITARWDEPESRSKKLEPYKEKTEQRIIDLLHKSFKEQTSQGKNVSAETKKTFLASAEQDISELMPFLKLRADALATEAHNALKERGSIEAAELEKIITQQITKLETELSKRVLEDRLFVDEEQRQLELDRKHWEKRIQSLKLEQEREPAKIKELYEVKTHRFWPVGIVYLWPVTG